MRRYWNKEVRFRCDFYHYSPESAAFDLGLERAGMRCVGQVEIEPFCQKVLAKHWPDVWRWNDVKTLTGETVRQHCETVDLLCGGVPCQPASVAGKRKGAADHRWLWPDFLRLVSEINPVWVLAENPRGITSLRVEGMQFSEWIAREFAARGYELLPFKLAAENVNAPHSRDRVWFMANPATSRRKASGRISIAQPGQASARNWPGERVEFGRGNSGRVRRLPDAELLRVDDGFPSELDTDRIAALGNAIVPQVAEVIGRAIMEASQNELR